MTHDKKNGREQDSLKRFEHAIDYILMILLVIVGIVTFFKTFF